MRKEYTLDNYKKMQIILLRHQMLVLQPDNDIAKSIYKGRNILAPLTIEQLCFRSSLTMKKKYAFDVVWKVQGPTSIVLAIQDTPFKVQLDREKRVHDIKTKNPIVRLETIPN